MLETTITSSVLIAVVILMRYSFKGKISPRLQYAFWLLAAVRLIVPFSLFESPLSVPNIVDVVTQAGRIESPAKLAQPDPAQHTGVTGGEGMTGVTGNTGASGHAVQGKTGKSDIALSEQAPFSGVLRSAWLIGSGIVGLWFVLQNTWFYTRLRRTREAVEVSGTQLPVYLARDVDSPCLFGFRPAIYIHPDGPTDDRALRYILAHEETHYRHGDHLWAYLRCICLTLHWFNPLVWWAAILSRRDCEIACDESTLSRIGDEHRRSYGNTLIDMIGCRARPSELLSATTMMSDKAGIKERMTMIARKPKMLISTLLTVVLAMAVVAGCTFTGANGSGKDVTLYRRGWVTIAIPKEYADQLLIDPTESDDESTLIRVYQKSAYEKYGGMGRLFSLARYTEAQYEQFLGSDGSGQTFFAKEDSKEGSHYYGFFFPTDMQSAPDDYESYSMLFSSVGDFVKGDFMERNRLTAYDDDEFFGRTYTYEGEHVFIKYYPYYAVNGSKDEVWTLFLSQPVKEGDAGIWCVERWRDQYGNTYPYFPDGDGIPSREYYAALQSEADAGRQASLLDPEQVAMAFVERVFEHRIDNPGSFERAANSGIPAELFAQSTGDIHDYLPRLMAGQGLPVSAYDLLPCLANFTTGTWADLTKAYGSEWWDPFWNALRDAAVSDMRADISDQLMRNYYLGKAFLVADGAYTEAISDLVLRQWRDNSQLYNRTLSSARFSTQEAATLRSHLVYLVNHRGGTFHLGIPGSDPELALSLNAYPVDFPFGLSLTEKSRETVKAESFGLVTVIESDGLQLKYLNNSEGVYGVFGIRAAKEGYFNTGVAIGDAEEKLWDHWLPKQLTKIDEISYDDEAWFGDDYDYAYAHTPEDSTKSILYLIKGDRVTGIELIDGLDGSLY